MHKIAWFCQKFRGRVGAQHEENLSKNKLSEIGQVGGCLTLIWKMSLNSHFFFDLTPNHCCDVSIELIIISIYHILYVEFWLSFPLNFSFCLWVKREEVGCSGMWKISLFYLNRILNFNSESITRIIVWNSRKLKRNQICTDSRHWPWLGQSGTRNQE